MKFNTSINRVPTLQLRNYIQFTVNYVMFALVLNMGSSPGDVCDELVMQVKQHKACRMGCGIDEAMVKLENELWRRWSNRRVGEWAEPHPATPFIASPISQLIFQSFCRFTYIPSPTSQLNPQPFCHFTYITAHSPTLLSLHLRHLVSRPWYWNIFLTHKWLMKIYVFITIV